MDYTTTTYPLTLANQLNEASFRELAQYHDIGCYSIYYPLRDVNKTSGTIESNLIELIQSKTNESDDFGIKNEYIFKQIKEELHHLEISKLTTGSLIFFICKDFSKLFAVPIHFENNVYINQHFYLKPIAPLFNQNNQYILLYYNQRQSRIYQVANNELNRKSIIKKDYKKDQDEYVERVIEKVQSITSDQNLSVVLATKPKYFEKLKSYRFFNQNLKKTILLSGGKLDLRMLRSRIKDFSAKIRKESKINSIKLLWNSKQRSKVLKENERIVISANKGELDTLFLEKGRDLYGEFDHHNSYVIASEKSEGASSLSNQAAVETILNEGNVYLLNRDEMPEDSHFLSAVLKSHVVIQAQ